MGNPAAYGASKAGLIQLSQYFATTLAPRVRCNAISPGGGSGCVGVAVGFSSRSNKANMTRSQQKKTCRVPRGQAPPCCTRSNRPRERESPGPVQSRVFPAKRSCAKHEDPTESDVANIALFLDPSRRSALGGFLRLAVLPQLDFFGRSLALALAELTIRSSITSYPW